MKQITLACHAFHEDHNRMPPAFGFFPRADIFQGGNALGNLFFHLLPYVEQQSLYEDSRHRGDAKTGTGPSKPGGQSPFSNRNAQGKPILPTTFPRRHWQHDPVRREVCIGMARENGDRPRECRGPVPVFAGGRLPAGDRAQRDERRHGRRQRPRAGARDGPARVVGAGDAGGTGPGGVNGSEVRGQRSEVGGRKGSEVSKPCWHAWQVGNLDAGDRGCPVRTRRCSSSQSNDL